MHKINFYLLTGLLWSIFMTACIEAHETANGQDTKNTTNSEPESNTTWTCASCTYINHIDLLGCEICDFRKSFSKRIGPWPCAACTYVNMPALSNCEMCGSECTKIIIIDPPGKNSQEEDSQEEVSECPICFEEDVLEKPGAHTCPQCEKSICQVCFAAIAEKSKRNSCPLCRYEPY